MVFIRVIRVQIINALFDKISHSSGKNNEKPSEIFKYFFIFCNVWDTVYPCILDNQTLVTSLKTSL